MKRLFGIMMVLVLAVSVAFAEASGTGLTYSDRFHAVSAAQHALAEKYFISEACNEYFMRTVKEEEDGSYTVIWEPGIDIASWSWLLGTYTAVVRGENVEISWTNDGKSTYGSLKDAEAWGAVQLQQIAEEVRTTFEMTESFAAADRPEYADKGDYPYMDTENNDYSNDAESRKAALEAASITPDEADAAARMALQEIYGNRDWERLETTDGEYDWNIGLLNGRPVIIIHYDLWGQGSDAWEWQEGDGTYTVTVNLKTGEIEEILYANGLSGNG